MAFTYVLTTDTGQMRALIPDNHTDDYLFADEELSVFLALEGGIKKGTALALETMASNEAMVLKVIRLLDITTDGAKVSDALLKRAALLRKQADDADDATSEAVDIVGWVLSPSQHREYRRVGHY